MKRIFFLFCQSYSQSLTQIPLPSFRQAKRRAGISPFRVRVRVREIPVFLCAETGMTALVQARAVVRWSD